MEHSKHMVPKERNEVWTQGEYGAQGAQEGSTRNKGNIPKERNRKTGKGAQEHNLEKVSTLAVFCKAEHSSEANEGDF